MSQSYIKEKSNLKILSFFAFILGLTIILSLFLFEKGNNLGQILAYSY